MKNRLNWTGHSDKVFGPFLYAYSKGDSLAVVVGSGDDEYRGARVRFTIGAHTLMIALPQWLVQPERTKVNATHWDDATVARLGRNWYYDVTEREYGFSFWEDSFSIMYGRQSNSSKTEKRLHWFLPWNQWKHVRHSIYDFDGTLVQSKLNKDLPKDFKARRELSDVWFDTVRGQRTLDFAFLDYDGEPLVAATRMEEREWRKGEGWFKWLQHFHKPMIHRSLDIQFSGETGGRKGSWKGGTIGHAIDMHLGESMTKAFDRYCTNHNMTFVGVVGIGPGEDPFRKTKDANLGNDMQEAQGSTLEKQIK